MILGITAGRNTMKRRQNGHTLTLGVAAVCAIGLNLQGTATAQVHYSYAHAPVTEKKGSTTVTEWRDALGRNPTTQVTQQHTTKDGKEVKTSSWDSLSGGGSSQPGGGEDEETQRVDDKTIRTVRRLFGTDANGNR